MPVLAICRGMQMLNVAHGGDLHQHLPELVGHEGHRETPGVFSEHEVEIAPESRTAGVIGARARVHSHHHQGLGAVGDGLRAVGFAEDGSVEVIEDPDRRFALGVLWHPEEGRTSGCSRRSSRRQPPTGAGRRPDRPGYPARPGSGR